MKILTGDIGGTKTRLVLLEVQAEHLEGLVEETYLSRDYAQFEEILKCFQKTHRFSFQHACFGIAGPVCSGRSQITKRLSTERVAYLVD